MESLEFGITDLETMNYMFEVAKKFKPNSTVNLGAWLIGDPDETYDKTFNEGYDEGYNDAVSEIESKLDTMTWEVGRMKK